VGGVRRATRCRGRLASDQYFAPLDLSQSVSRTDFDIRDNAVCIEFPR
jgi:hypothetical protein